ncbi:MAG: DUF669 domain-containing protein [Bacilli bacterium]|nr:DUF669 domain-containing protein [Bacilli bacterium]
MFDYSEKRSFEPVEPGEYEVQITNAELKQSQTGKNCIAVSFTIRDDVEQNHQNRIIFENIWENDVYRRNDDGKRIKKDDYNAMSPQEKQAISIKKEYDDIKIRTIIQAQDNDETIIDANGNKVANPQYKTRFSNLEEVVMFMNGLNIRIKVTKYMDDKNGVERNGIDYNGIKRTKHHPVATPAQNVQPAASTQPVQSANQATDDINLPW